MKSYIASKYSLLFSLFVILLFSFNGVWHPLLHCCHGGSEKEEPQKLVQASVSFSTGSSDCLLCSGYFVSETPPENSNVPDIRSRSYDTPSGTGFLPYRIPRIYAARAPPYHLT